MAVACHRVKHKARKPKLSDVQQEALYKQYLSGAYTVADLAEIYKVSPPAGYCVIDRMKLPHLDEAAQPMRLGYSIRIFGPIRLSGTI
jgi:hypothetical protein